MRGLRWVAAGVLGIAVSMSVSAAGDERSEKIIEDRIAGFRDMGAAFKNITDELKSAQPNTAHIKNSARVVRDYSVLIAEWFPAGSEPPPKAGWLDGILGWFSSTAAVVGEPETHAKAEIWSEQAQFMQVRRQFEAEVADLWRVAQTADVSAIKAQHRKVGKACSACHETFREPMD